MGLAFSKKSKQPTYASNEEKVATGVDFSQTESAHHHSETTERLSVSRVLPVSVATSSINSKRNPPNAAALTSRCIIPSSRVLKSQNRKLMPRKRREIIRGRRLTRSSTKSKNLPPIAKKQPIQATKATKPTKPRDEIMKCTTSNNRNVCLLDFRVDILTLDDRISSDGAVNKNSVSNSANAEPNKKTSKYEKNVQKHIVKDAVDLVLDKHLSVPGALIATFVVCTRQNLYRAVKKRRQSIRDGEHAGKLVVASDTQMSSISSLSQKSKKSRKSVKRNNKVFIEEKLKRQEFENHYNRALIESILLWTRTKETWSKKLKNKNYMRIDKTIKTILKEVNHKYLSEDSKKITKGTLLQYYNNDQNTMLRMGLQYNLTPH